jgi:hypothetical protein
MTDATKAEPCPFCEVSDFLAIQSVTGPDRPTQRQVFCHGCDMAGPTAPTTDLAFGIWSQMPRL